jgi:hypothetical protein
MQVVVERLMAFLRSTACGGDELLRRHIAGQIVDLAEKYAPDTTWFVGVMAEVRIEFLFISVHAHNSCSGRCCGSAMQGSLWTWLKSMRPTRPGSWE